MTDKTEAPPCPKTYRDLVVWQKAHMLTLKLFEMALPQHMASSAMREHSSATAANIVVSYRKKNRDEKLLHLGSALDSLERCRYYAVLSHDLQLLPAATYEQLHNHINEVGFLLNNYFKSIAKPRDNEASAEPNATFSPPLRNP